jgi:hypothetical protein
MVTVPAGTFSCLRVHRVDSAPGGYDSTFWFARNIGKVKEGGTEVQELVGYSIPSAAGLSTATGVTLGEKVWPPSGVEMRLTSRNGATIRHLRRRPGE